MCRISGMGTKVRGQIMLPFNRHEAKNLDQVTENQTIQVGFKSWYETKIVR